MMIQKQYVLDEERQPVAVQIPLEQFEKIEEVLENYGLAKLIDEVQGDERLGREDALEYYRALKNELGS